MPRKKQGHERALGPYPHGGRWRVVYVGANGAREVESYSTEAEAVEARDAANITAGNRTLIEAIDMYLDAHKTAPGHDTIKYRLRAFLRVKDGDRPLVTLTEPVAASLYLKRTTDTVGRRPIAAATHHGELRYAKQFGAWCVAKGWLPDNPFAAVEPIGEVNKGKPKLRVNGTRAFLKTLLADTSIEAAAVLTALTLKLRASAVVNRLVEDLDDEGWILWVRDSKTRASDLEIELPEFLRARLLALVEGKEPKDRIFGSMTRYALHYHTVKFCKAAKVDRVTPHGLRGSGATQAVRSGEAIERVAREIGHADKGATLKGHYLGGGAIESGHARYIERLVTKRPGIVPDPDEPGSN